MSRLFEFKGFQYFLEAIKDIDVDYEINIVGEGPYKETLVQKAKDLKVKVNFIGWLDNTSPELKNLYETSSIFVFPSIAENFPTVLLEAMAAGCAIITTDDSGCPEVVGDAALLVRPKNSEDIMSALGRLITDDKLRNELLFNSRKRVQKNYTWEKVSKHYINIYNNILNEE